VSVVFSHGRLRLYLLKVLADGPRHGYELIRLLEDRFLGLYAPSAGTIYPRLQRMEGDGLVAHTAAGGRKVYRITGVGRAELAARTHELAALERDIQESIAGAAGGAPTQLERDATELLEEVRRMAASKTASPEAIRTAAVVVETALEQVRRLAR
jgi:DNA-binding PadR family transcriptional regulator